MNYAFLPILFLQTLPYHSFDDPYATILCVSFFLILFHVPAHSFHSIFWKPKRVGVETDRNQSKSNYPSRGLDTLQAARPV
jgi:hypothetical protein